MLTVEQISKRYGHRTALREVSFTAETGRSLRCWAVTAREKPR